MVMGCLMPRASGFFYLSAYRRVYTIADKRNVCYALKATSTKFLTKIEYFRFENVLLRVLFSIFL